MLVRHKLAFPNYECKLTSLVISQLIKYTKSKSCLTGKAKCDGLRNSSKVPNPAHKDFIKIDDLQPGARVSCNQYECKVKGRLPYTKGKEDPKLMLVGRTLFVDHASGYIKIYNQVSLGASDNIRSKELYELQAW